MLKAELAEARRRGHSTNVSTGTKASAERCCQEPSFLHPSRALTVGEIGALSDFDNVTVRIADVAADFAVLGDRLGDELRSSTFP